MPHHELQAADLTRTLENGDLILHYQPQVDITRPWPAIVGYEALVRWPLPDGSIVPPGRFLPWAQESGLAPALDTWVLEAVCLELARMRPNSQAREMSVSANVSPQLFRHPNLAATVSDILTRTGINPARLTLEITEKAVLEVDPTTCSNIHALREVGVSLSLDDFGTGFSSLFHLQSLPIQEIKLDRSFVVGLPQNDRDSIIAAAVIELALKLNLRVVAEGVELAEQVEWLRGKGCQWIQGYLYGGPAPRGYYDTAP